MKNLRQYSATTDKIAPNWMMISKFFVRAFLLIPINVEAIIMCPVDEMGKNSVMPSIMERISASRYVIRWFVLNNECKRIQKMKETIYYME